VVESLVIAYLGLGSNLGDRAAFIAQAIEALRQEKEIHVKRMSSVLETKPVGPLQDQPDFLNTVVEVETSLQPMKLLERLLAIEQKLGRTRTKRWGPRTIDMDILLYGDEQVAIPPLTIPHPEIKNRGFILAGLRELGRTVK
jgi:2-amino-4-hydroxy-6-hydroxymethyldihydropteridine diphosphokinase